MITCNTCKEFSNLAVVKCKILSLLHTFLLIWMHYVQIYKLAAMIFFQVFSGMNKGTPLFGLKP